MSFIKKLAGYVWAPIVFLLGLLAIVMFRKNTDEAKPISTDVDNNGKADAAEIKENLDKASVHREEAKKKVEEAKAILDKPIEVTPARSAADAVKRNNDLEDC